MADLAFFVRTYHDVDDAITRVTQALEREGFQGVRVAVRENVGDELAWPERYQGSKGALPRLADEGEFDEGDLITDDED